MHFYCEKLYLWPETGTDRGFNRPLGAKDVKCTRVGNLAGGGFNPSNPPTRTLSISDIRKKVCRRKVRKKTYKKYNFEVTRSRAVAETADDHTYHLNFDV